MTLIKCPECGRDVSTLAAACPGCGRPIAAADPPGPAQPEAPPAQPGFLRSNVGDVTVAPRPSKRSGFPVVAVLVVALLAVLVGAVVVLLQPASTPVAQRTASVAATTAPVAGRHRRELTANRTRWRAPANHQRHLVRRAGVDDLPHPRAPGDVRRRQEQQIPFGVGIGQPWQVSDSDEGPFVTDGSCFYWIHTHTEDGIIHIESPVRRTFTLGDFFAIWQQPLSATPDGTGAGRDHRLRERHQGRQTNPADIRLLSHERIQLDIGQDVPPYPFDFPPGD